MLILSHFPLDNKTFSSAKYVSYKEQIFSHLCTIHDMFLCTLAKLYRSCSGIGPHNQANPSLNYAVHLCSLQLPQCSIKRIKGQKMVSHSSIQNCKYSKYLHAFSLRKYRVSIESRILSYVTCSNGFGTFSSFCSLCSIINRCASNPENVDNMIF